MKTILIVFSVLFILACKGETNQLAGKALKSRPTDLGMPSSDYDPEAKLEDLQVVLRDQGTPVANYVHAVRSGNLLFLAGKGPKQANGENITGKVGADLDIEQGYAAAREVGINQLSVLKASLGNLNKVKRIVKVKGMVNATPDFTDHSKVINGYSDLMVAVFGEAGKHARAAVGMASLPGNMAVEIEMVVELWE